MLKWASEQDVKEYLAGLEQERRGSLAFRNAEGKRQCDLQADMEADEKHRVHERYEDKWTGEKTLMNIKS